MIDVHAALLQQFRLLSTAPYLESVLCIASYQEYDKSLVCVTGDGLSGVFRSLQWFVYRCPFVLNVLYQCCKQGRKLCVLNVLHQCCKQGQQLSLCVHYPECSMSTGVYPSTLALSLRHLLLSHEAYHLHQACISPPMSATQDARLLPKQLLSLSKDPPPLPCESPGGGSLGEWLLAVEDAQVKLHMKHVTYHGVIRNATSQYDDSQSIINSFACVLLSSEALLH